MSKEEIGKRIKAARLAKGLTQADVANYLKVTPQAVSNFERGKNRISNDILKELCELYQISADILLDNIISSFEETPNSPGEDWLHDSLVSLYPKKFINDDVKSPHNPPFWVNENQKFTNELCEHLRTISDAERKGFLFGKIEEINPSEVEFFIARKLYEHDNSESEILNVIFDALPGKYQIRIQNIKSVLIAMRNVQDGQL